MYEQNLAALERVDAGHLTLWPRSHQVLMPRRLSHKLLIRRYSYGHPDSFVTSASSRPVVHESSQESECRPSLLSLPANAWPHPATGAWSTLVARVLRCSCPRRLPWLRFPLGHDGPAASLDRLAAGWCSLSFALLSRR
jgi:hypothetical protein